MTTWKESLEGRLPSSLAHEIDGYDDALAQKREGHIDNAVFGEMRLRRGVYGQRYDNGQRHDGEKTQALAFPCGDLLKGKETVWDAPGMQRIKIPFGRLTPEQTEALAEVAEEYADGILHVTTRQDIQLHFVHIDDTPDLMRRIGAVGITTREACGNVIRNVTACSKAGVCSEAPFDVSPYANAAHEFFLGHPDTQNFGRKFKIAFSGCAGSSCGLVNIHDVGCIARTREVGGVEERGFEFYVGGGLGAVPYQAQVFDDFLPQEEVLPTIQAIARVFGRLGEKENRARARMKFLIKKLGLDEFKRLVAEEKKDLASDARWTAYIDNLDAFADGPLRAPTALEGAPHHPDFALWRETNVERQSQAGYVLVTLALPLGDLTADQMRAVADIARTYTGPTTRTTIEQNILLRWVNEGDLHDLYRDLKAAGLARPGAQTIADATACPGTDTCKLGVAASRALANELNEHLGPGLASLDPALRKLRVKASGCFNSCGQHHVADIGFWGVSRKVRGELVPHNQVVLGGQWENNGGAYGLAIGAIPARNTPKALDRITAAYLEQKQGDESFQGFIERVGKPAIRALIEDLLAVPEYADDPSYYYDWGDPRRYTIGDIGQGECAGEVVATTEFDLQASEREVFQAQLRLDGKDIEGAADIAYRAMMLAAKALARTQNPAVKDEPNVIIDEFRARLYDTKLFFDRYAGGKFAHYLFRAHDEVAQRTPPTEDLARKRIEEAQLFVEAAHACFGRMS